MRELVGACNVYIAGSGQAVNARLLQTIAQYLTHLFRVFGVVPSDQTIGFPLEGEKDSDNKVHVQRENWGDTPPANYYTDFATVILVYAAIQVLIELAWSY